MITNKRRFIRLDEISEKTHLAKGDVFDSIENGELRFCATIDALNLGATAKKGDTTYVVAIFNYNGMVKLLKTTSKRLAISLETASAKDCIIVEPEKITNWKSVPESFENFESANFNYMVKAFSKPRIQFLAYSQIVSTPTTDNVVGKFASAISLALPREKRHVLTDPYPESNSFNLETKAIKIEPNRVRIDLDDIEEIFGKESLKVSGYLPLDSGSLVVSSPVTSSQPAVDLAVNFPVISGTLTETVAVKPVIFTHPIEQIVHRVLIANSSLNADKIWVLIRKDVNQEGQRIYDIDNVIDEMTADSVSWFGKGESLDNEMSYDSFRKSTVYRLKKRLKEEDKS